MRKRNYLFFMLFCIGIMSCTNENDPILTNDSENPQLRSLGDGKFDILGHGYNITDKYLDGTSSKASVIDVTKMNQKQLITPAILSGTTYSHYSGTDIIDFSRAISADMGLEFLSFVGSLNTNFKSSYKFNSKESFAFYSLEYPRASYTLSATLNDLRANLTTNFQTHIATASPQEIVRIYGTHVLTKVIVGARLEAFMKTETTTTNKTGAVEAKLGVTINKLFGIKANFSYNESLATQTRNTKMFYKTTGGTAELESGEFIDVDGTTVSSPKLNMVKWSSTIPTSVPLFIDTDKDNLIPIYELVSDNSKRAALEAYVKQYIKESQPESIDNYSSAGGVRILPFFGHETQGAGVALADINGNGIKDMIMMTIDNPKGENSVYYKILYDLDEFGNSNKQSEDFNLGSANGGHENQGGSVTVADLNKNGIPDMIFAIADHPKGSFNPIYYKVAFDIDQSGKPKSVSGFMTLSNGFGTEYNDIGIDMYDFNKNGIPDIIFMAYDNPKGPNTFRYQIGYDMDASGIIRGGYSQTYIEAGVGDEGEGAGIAVGDFNRNGIPDILLTALDAPAGENKFRYKILWDVNSAGYSYNTPTSIYPTFTNLYIGNDHQGGDCAIADINKDGILDILFLAMDNPKGANSWKYITGFNFTTSGYIQTWR